MWKIWINYKEKDGSHAWQEMCASNYKPYLYESEDHAKWSCKSLYPRAVYGIDVVVSKDMPSTNPIPSEDPFALTIF